MGTGSFAVPSLESLIALPAHELAALVTQPDKPAGRGHELRQPATKRVALEHGVDVYQPAKVRTPESIDLVRSIAPDCIVVVAYGQIIPQAILDIPPKGIINVHASLLPLYRGAAPIQWAIARGEVETGVTTMLMDAGLDTGAVLLQEITSIGVDETSAELEPRLASLGAQLLVQTLEKWESDGLVPEPQNDDEATLAPRIKKDDARIDWSDPAHAIACQVRAFNPWPVTFTALEGAQLKIWRASVTEGISAGSPGSIDAVHADDLDVVCGGGTLLRVREVQVSGKARMAAGAFARGRRLEPGSRLGG